MNFLLLKQACIILCWVKPNGFQYSFLTIHSFYSIIINTTVVELVLRERKLKKEITSKNSFTNNCNKMVDPNKKFFQLNYYWKLIYVKQCIIFIFFVKYLYESFNCGFPLSLTRFISIS